MVPDKWTPPPPLLTPAVVTLVKKPQTYVSIKNLNQILSSKQNRISNRHLTIESTHSVTPWQHQSQQTRKTWQTFHDTLEVSDKVYISKTNISGKITRNKQAGIILRVSFLTVKRPRQVLKLLDIYLTNNITICKVCKHVLTLCACVRNEFVSFYIHCSKFRGEDA